MKLQYLGTGSCEGTPAIFCNCEVCHRAKAAGGKNIRTRSQACIDDTLLIDFPADTYLHVLRDGLPLEDIQSCIITHDHEDHYYPGEVINIRPALSCAKEGKCLTFYGTAPAGAKLYPIITQHDLDKNGLAAFQVIEPFVPFEANGYTITPLRAEHDPFCAPVIYLIEKDGKCILYSNDTGYYPEDTWDYLKAHPRHIDLASFDCSSGPCECGSNRHMGILEDIKVRDRLTKIGCIDSDTICILTHISHRTGVIHDEFTPIAARSGFAVAYDGLCVTI